MEEPATRSDSLVLAVINGGPSDPEIVSAACRLAQRRGAALRGLYVMEIPGSEPLASCREECEEQARAALAAARELAQASGCTMRGCVLPARDAGQAIVEEAAECGADAVVIARPHESLGGDAYRRILREVHCTVLAIPAREE